MKQSHLKLRRNLFILLVFIIVLFGLYFYGLYNPSIPILMYHHVNNHKGDLVTITPQAFEKQMAYIKDNFNSIHLSEFLLYLEEGKRFPPRTCVITFDDGYYDNFVHAYPVLKKYNLKATIFVITSHIGEERKNYEIKKHFQANLEAAIAHYAGRSSEKFLTWGELKEMGESGLIDIQSHTLTHARYFVSSRIIDFNSGLFPWWLPHATGGDIRLGIPIYEDQKSLLALRYFDDASLRDYLVQYVADKGGEEFFKSRQKEEWLNELFSVVDGYERRCGPRKGYFETAEERKIRLKEELYFSRKAIENKLGKECLFIAWPWGRYDEELVTLARQYGYRGAVATEKGANTSCIDIMQLKRFDIKTGNLHWFRKRLFMYSHGIIARVYSIIRGK